MQNISLFFFERESQDNIHKETSPKPKSPDKFDPNLCLIIPDMGILREYLARYCVLLKCGPTNQLAYNYQIIFMSLKGESFAHMTRTHTIFHVKAFHHASI